jgi:hypothetical protein
MLFEVFLTYICTYNRNGTTRPCNRPLTVPLTTQEISEVIRSLPNGKAPGFDGITYKHLKFGGDI